MYNVHVNHTWIKQLEYTELILVQCTCTCMYMYMWYGM